MSDSIRTELLRVRRMPPWGRQQGNDWDGYSHFVYHVESLDELRRATRRVAAEAGLPVNDFASYVIHRWYNYHTHQVVLDMLCAHRRVRREDDPRHRTVDLYLDDRPFDLKLTRFPHAYPGRLDDVRRRPLELVNWLYQNQSSGGRYHTANRLFLVLHHAGDAQRTWEVRRMFDLLQATVDEFLSCPRLLRADLTANGQSYCPWAGLLWCIYAPDHGQEDGL